MKLLELVGVMNVADVSVASKTIPGLLPLQALDMFHQSSDPILQRYGSREVESITNICKQGITIWIK